MYTLGTLSSESHLRHCLPPLVTTAAVLSLEYGQEYSLQFPDSTRVSRYVLLIFAISLFTLCTCRSPWVEVCGTRYSRQSVVVLNCVLVPEFGVIQDIVLDDLQQPLFVCKKLLTDCFYYHYHSYKVVHSNPPVFCIKKQSALFDHSVLSTYNVESSLYVHSVYYLVE